MPLNRKNSSLTPPTLNLSPTPRPSRAPSTSSHSSSHPTRTSMDSSADSGYASASGSGWLSPNSDWLLSRTYENWKIADSAAQRLVADLRQREKCKAQLRAAKKRETQTEKSLKASRKPSLLHIPFRRRPSNTLEPHLASASPMSLSEPSTLEPLLSVEELEARLDALNKRVTATQAAADRADSYFEDLRKVFGDGRPVSMRSSISSEGHQGGSYVDEYTKARRTVEAFERSYADSKATTEALRHACTAIQSAHHHYSTAMDLLEAVCSPKKTRWEAMVGDEQSRQETYREAAELAQKAEICFRECVRSLEPHRELLKRDEAQDCEDLQETGLLQAVKLYNLMYGGKALAMGITQQVQTMIQKQDAVFQRLTSFAVWVQNCTEECRSVELDAWEARDGARRALVALWVRADEEAERYSLAAPSEHSHVFRT